MAEDIVHHLNLKQTEQAPHIPHYYRLQTFTFQKRQSITYTRQDIAKMGHFIYF
jgi:hypothetical protein